jgi:hypothetical protein
MVVRKNIFNGRLNKRSLKYLFVMTRLRSCAAGLDRTTIRSSEGLLEQYLVSGYLLRRGLARRILGSIMIRAIRGISVSVSGNGAVIQYSNHSR